MGDPCTINASIYQKLCASVTTDLTVGECEQLFNMKHHIAKNRYSDMKN